MEKVSAHVPAPETLTPLLLILGAYLLGSVPTSHWVSLAFFKTDLRTRGSGNLGATNTLRVLGWKPAVPVFLVDIFKGWLPVTVTSIWIPDAGPWVLPLVAAASVLGHVFSVWAGFRGGKGVATSTGVFLALAPLPLLVGLVVWVGTVLTFRIVSLASILSAVTLPIAMFFLPHLGGGAVEVFTLFLGLFVLWSHRANIGRLLRGEEHRFGKKQSNPTVATSPAQHRQEAEEV